MLAWEAALNLKSMLGNRFPCLPFLFFCFFCQRQPWDLYLQCFSLPVSSQLHNETFVTQKLLVRIALLNILIRNAIFTDRYSWSRLSMISCQKITGNSGGSLYMWQTRRPIPSEVSYVQLQTCRARGWLFVGIKELKLYVIYLACGLE